MLIVERNKHTDDFGQQKNLLMHTAESYLQAIQQHIVQAQQEKVFPLCRRPQTRPLRGLQHAALLFHPVFPQGMLENNFLAVLKTEINKRTNLLSLSLLCQKLPVSISLQGPDLIFFFLVEKAKPVNPLRGPLAQPSRHQERLHHDPPSQSWQCGPHRTPWELKHVYGTVSLQGSQCHIIHVGTQLFDVFLAEERNTGRVIYETKKQTVTIIGTSKLWKLGIIIAEFMRKMYTF